MKLHPMHPAVWVLDELAADGWQTHDLLAFTRASTLVLGCRGHDEPVVVKAGFGSNHVLAAMDTHDRPAAYGFYWYQQMSADEWGLARDDFRYERDLARNCFGATHIVPVLDEGTCGEFDWYAMPYYPDGNLRALLTENPTPASLARRLSILADVGDGLDELHRRGIVHRDVYQENVLVDETGRGVITDLGAARRTSEPRGPRHRGPEIHWPPEYAGSYTEATPAADVYSLAVLAYRTLFADLPRLDGPRHHPGLSTTTTDHLTAALAHDPDDRPTMSHLRASLREAAATTP